jgi:hypothetical protein
MFKNEKKSREDLGIFASKDKIQSVYEVGYNTKNV